MNSPSTDMYATAAANSSPDGPYMDEGTPLGYIPLGYYVDFVRMLAEHPRLFSVITYRDLAWEDDYDGAAGYPQERARWQLDLRSGKLDPDRIYVLLQHDVDSNPERTMDVLRAEAQLGIRSNVMIFNRRISRHRLRTSGILAYTPYPLDFDLLTELQRDHGFIVGYHSNAYEQALFDARRAEQIFTADVETLRERFDIEFFSAHGGTPGPDNLNNRDLPVPEFLRANLRWVHNGRTPWFTATYSDGGINSPQRDPGRRDLRDFVRSWRPGGRYRVLTHPQYYSWPCTTSPRMAGTTWYEQVQECYGREPTVSAWTELRNECASALTTGTWFGDGRPIDNAAIVPNRWLALGRTFLRKGVRLVARLRSIGSR